MSNPPILVKLGFQNDWLYYILHMTAYIRHQKTNYAKQNRIMAQPTINRRDKTVQFSDLIILSSFHINIEHDIVPYDKEPSS